MHATLAELRLIAGIEASKISFDWDMMENYPTVQEELLGSFEYAQGVITSLEARYTMLMDSGAVPEDMGYNQMPISASFSELLLVTDELLAAYVLADLRDRYAAIEAVLV